MRDPEKSEPSGMLLLFAMLDLLAIEEEPALSQAITTLKGVIRKIDPISGHQILRHKMHALLTVRDDLLLKLRNMPEPSAPTKASSQPPQSKGIPSASPHQSVGEFIEQLLDLLEGTSHQSDTYSENLDRGIKNLQASKTLQEIRTLTGHLLESATDMQSATQAFQSGITEMATMVFDFQRKVQDLETELKEQKEIAMIDKLTGVHNRRAFDIRIEELLAQARRFHAPLCLFLLDLDHFKDINDNFGHKVGDEVLISFARLLRTSCREYDMVFRFGGDEFAVIFPSEGMEEAKLFANRIHEFMKHNSYRHQDLHTKLDVKINVGVSGGMAQLRDSEDSSNLFSRADKKLYEAKHSGRGQFAFD